MTNTLATIFYIDDEPRNLSLMDVMLSGLYNIKTFENPMDAIKAMKAEKPNVILTDQRMPGMSGLEFLEVAAQILPDTPRIIVTGQTDEETMIKLVRQTQIFDYITKPVREDELLSSIAKAVEKQKSTQALSQMIKQIEDINRSLEKKNQEIELQYNQLIVSQEKEKAFRREAEAWASTEVIKALVEDKIKFPIKRDLVCITFDIVNSKNWHGVKVNDRDVRGEILNSFTGLLLRHNGIQENHGGDAAFGHFGAFGGIEMGISASLAVAQEFRSSLRNLSRMHNLAVECGVAIHLVTNATIDVHQVVVERDREVIVKKFLSSSAPGIDSLFRLEKLTHQLPGSNIIMSQEIYDRVQRHDESTICLGVSKNKEALKGQKIYLIPSVFKDQSALERLKADNFEPEELEKKSLPAA